VRRQQQLVEFRARGEIVFAERREVFGDLCRGYVRGFLAELLFDSGRLL
jgi:hypothetical protein